MRPGLVLRVLGSAAGGGFPQWNCGCANCAGLRSGAIAATPRTQDTLAVPADGDAWALLNASPDLLAQLVGCAALAPRPPRHSPVRAVVLTSGELDHVGGLLSLRETSPLAIYATAAVRDGLARAEPRFVASARHLAWRLLPLGRPVALRAADDTPLGILVEAHAVPGKVPRHLVGVVPPAPDDVVALRLQAEAGGGVVAYCPGAARVEERVRAALAGADVVLFDGTFWTSDELARAGVGTARAESMAHAPLDGPDGSLVALAELGARRRVLTHLNNTNPLLRDDAPERACVAAAGWVVAWDGMEVRA